EAANSASRCCGFTSPESTAKSWMSCAVSVRWMLALSPTAISSKVRLRIRPRSAVVSFMSAEDVKTGIDVQRAAGDVARRVAGQEGAQRADVVDVHQPPQRRAAACVVQQRIEVRDA